MRILLTRPLEDSLRTAQELAELGHTAVVAPLFETRSLDGPELTLDGVQAILATSSNGVRALARRCARRDVPVFAVGTRTAAAAYESGFAAIGDAGGDAKALEAMVSAQLQPEAGALLHAAGANSTGELAAALAHKGFEVHRCVLYEAVEVRELPSAAGEALGAG
ncbi:MAG: uroporphyrinogen-III synthase, partial [Rhizomicrobium sp.]